MGRCQEFGPQIREGCGHAMRPGDSACYCSECGATCQGRYPGCPDVWKRGLRTATTAVVTVDRPRLQLGASSADDGPKPASAEDASPRGISPKGISPKGIAPAGISPEGISARGILAKAPSAKQAPARDEMRPGERAGLGRVVAGPKPPVPGNSAAEGTAPEEEWAAPRTEARPGTRPAPGPDLATDERKEARELEPPDVTVAPPPGPRSTNGAVTAPTASPGTEPVWPPPPPAAAESPPPPRAEPVVRPTPPPPQATLVTPADVEATSAQGDPRTHILKWMERKFDGLRDEVRLVANGARRQGDILDEVLERQAELEAQIERQTELDADPDRQAELEARQAELEALVRRQEDVALRLERETERRQADPDGREGSLIQAAHDELARLVGEVVSLTESSVTTQQENSERLRLLQTAVTRQLRGVTAAMEQFAERSQDQVAALERRIDALSRKIPGAKPPARSAATKSEATSKSAEPTKAAARKSGATSKSQAATKPRVVSKSGTTTVKAKTKPVERAAASRSPIGKRASRPAR